MDVQATPPTFAAINTGEPPAGNPPVLGQQVPGETGGLPAQGGLSVLSSPMAYQLQSMDAQQSSQSSQTYPTAPNNPVTVYSAPASDAQSTYPPVYPLSPSFEEPQDGDSVEQFARGGVARAAQQTRTMGRGNDTMLVHMTPAEVNSLQGLAMAHGGSLTINPQTGLPEAGFLSRILPTLLGVGLAATGVGAPLAAGIVGLGSTVITGDIRKGLMAGLGAFGGAGLAGAAGLGGAVSENAFGILSDKAGLLGANMGAGLTAATPEVASSLVPEVAPQVAPQTIAEPTARYVTEQSLGPLGLDPYAASATPTAATAGTAPANLIPSTFGSTGAIPSNIVQSAVGQGGVSTVFQPTAPGFLSRFGQYTSIPGAPGIVNKALPLAAGYGAIAPALTPSYEDFPEQEEEDYTIPQYRLRSVYPRIPEGPAYNREGYQGEYQFFDPAGPQRMAEGDEVPAPAPGGLASLGASLPEYVKMFQTSPGAVTGVPYGYGPGQSPTELIRAQIAANAAAAPPAAIAPAASPIAAAPSFGAETDYGLMKNAPRSNPMSLYDYDSYGSFNGYGYPSDFSALVNAAVPTPAPTPTPTPTLIPAQTITPGNPMAGSELDYGFMKSAPSPQAESVFTSENPYDYLDYYGYGYGYGYAHGGAVEMESGGFVMPARETAEFGNGSTEAGQRRLAAMGGMPIRGRGDGVSDSIPARIDGTQRARLADGETYFPPRAVERMGGADKLRAMMNKATKSRQQAARGGDNKLRGLA